MTLVTTLVAKAVLRFPHVQVPTEFIKLGLRKKSRNMISLTDLEVEMLKAIAILTNEKDKGPTIDDCHEKIKGLGLEHTDPMYLAAFTLFGSKNSREAWMMLPSEPGVLKGFIKMMAKSKGIFSGTEWVKDDFLHHPILSSFADKIEKTSAQVALLSGLQMGHGVILKSTNDACIKEKFSAVDWSTIPDYLFAEFSNPIELAS
ncbi:NADPH-dependent aldo-keto reductase, chloroplastic-like protein [Tanacetum coccineum]